eukprot:COSAG01_NODE_13792_length_1534_cov_3.428571_1_plen_71_part_01
MQQKAEEGEGEGADEGEGEGEGAGADGTLALSSRKSCTGRGGAVAADKIGHNAGGEGVSAGRRLNRRGHGR